MIDRESGVIENRVRYPMTYVSVSHRQMYLFESQSYYGLFSSWNIFVLLSWWIDGLDIQYLELESPVEFPLTFRNRVTECDWHGIHLYTMSICPFFPDGQKSPLGTLPSLGLTPFLNLFQKGQVYGVVELSLWVVRILFNVSISLSPCSPRMIFLFTLVHDLQLAPAVMGANETCVEPTY